MIAEPLNRLPRFGGLKESIHVKGPCTHLLNPRHVDGRTHFRGNGLGHIFAAGLINLLDFAANRQPLRLTGQLPSFESFLSGGNSSIRIGLTAQGDMTDHCLSGGVDNLKIRTVDRIDPLTVDIKLTLVEHGADSLMLRDR